MVSENCNARVVGVIWDFRLECLEVGGEKLRNFVFDISMVLQNRDGHYTGERDDVGNLITMIGAGHGSSLDVLHRRSYNVDIYILVVFGFSRLL